MVRRKDRQSGSSTAKAVAVVAAIGAVTAIGAAIWVVHPPADAATSPNTAPASSQTATQPPSNSSAQPAYAAWPVKANTAYGFSLSYPTSWTPSGDVTIDPKMSATRQEFATSLTFNTAPQNYPTADFEVLDEPLQSAAAWYDQYYAQTPIKVSKTTASLKGKQSVQYDFVAPTYESKRYLFAVGSKTYMFSSVYESINVSTDPSYWSDFDEAFNSLNISN